MSCVPINRPFSPPSHHPLPTRSTKMKLFASFDEKVDVHNNILEEREKVLVGVRERLVLESGNVLGRGCGNV
jgi:hypothetical protein